MHPPIEAIAGDPATGLLIIADHSSAAVPEGVSLGVPERLMAEHVAVDIGIDPLARSLAAALGCPALLATASRLVVDLNRDPEDSRVVPVASDGHAIPDNAALDERGRAERIAHWWWPYHRAVAARIAEERPALLVSLHSFTPRLASAPEPRPWEVGVLYNRDERAARLAIPLLEAAGVVTGDNEPYSGRLLNATMNRHGEGNGIPYMGLEVRQDLIGDAAGVVRWSKIIAPVIASTFEGLRGQAPAA